MQLEVTFLPCSDTNFQCISVFSSILMQTIKMLHRASQKAFCLHPISLLCITNLIIVLCDTTSNRLRHCATSQKVASSIPGGVTGIFH